MWFTQSSLTLFYRGIQNEHNLNLDAMMTNIYFLNAALHICHGNLIPTTRYIEQSPLKKLNKTVVGLESVPAYRPRE